MTEITKKAERLARALATVENTLAFGVAFDRAHWGWPEYLEKAQAIIDAQNLFEYCEGTRPLHREVRYAKLDQDIYYAHYTEPGDHARATAIVHGLEEDNG